MGRPRKASVQSEHKVHLHSIQSGLRGHCSLISSSLFAFVFSHICITCQDPHVENFFAHCQKFDGSVASEIEMTKLLKVSISLPGQGGRYVPVSRVHPKPNITPPPPLPSPRSLNPVSRRRTNFQRQQIKNERVMLLTVLLFV